MPGPVVLLPSKKKCHFRPSLGWRQPHFLQRQAPPQPGASQPCRVRGAAGMSPRLPAALERPASATSCGHRAWGHGSCGCCTQQALPTSQKLAALPPCSVPRRHSITLPRGTASPRRGGGTGLGSPKQVPSTRMGSRMLRSTIPVALCSPPQCDPVPGWRTPGDSGASLAGQRHHRLCQQTHGREPRRDTRKHWPGTRHGGKRWPCGEK